MRVVVGRIINFSLESGVGNARLGGKRVEVSINDLQHPYHQCGEVSFALFCRCREATMRNSRIMAWMDDSGAIIRWVLKSVYEKASGKMQLYLKLQQRRTRSSGRRSPDRLPVSARRGSRNSRVEFNH